MARTKGPGYGGSAIGTNGLSNRQPPPEESFEEMKELGVAGAKITSGFVHDEFLQSLVDRAGRRVYRQMRDNDDVIGAIFFILEGIVRAVDWRIEYEEGDAEATSGANTDDIEHISYRNIDDPEKAIAFLEGVLFDDMDHTWEDYLIVVLTAYVFGWQYTEIVWKKRNGIKTGRDQLSSVFNDGLIGIHRLADRSQETLWKWDVDNYGTVFGMWQEDPNGGGTNYIPIEKAIHFTATTNKGNPEGRSILRNAYRPWFFKKNIQEQESIGIERELNGLPIVYIPDSILNGDSAEAAAALRGYESLVRDVKFNEQGGIVLPSDPWRDAEGNVTNMRQVEFSLVTAGGTRAIDTDNVIKRYDMAIARTVIAQFLMMSQSGSKGGFAQSRNETDLFFRAVEGMVNNIASTINRQLIPKIWRINGLNQMIMPFIKPGRLDPVDIDQLGNFIKNLASAGFSLFDPETEEFLREAGGLPGIPEQSEDEVVFDNGEEESTEQTVKAPPADQD